MWYLNINMDYMHISGTEPSSVIHDEIKQFNNWKEMPQMCQNKLMEKIMV